MTDWKDLSKVSPQEIDAEGEKWGKNLAVAKITTNQIRNIYSVVQQIRTQKDRLAQEEISRQLIFLKPKLAYTSGRFPELKPFRGFLVEAINGVVNSQTFNSCLD